MALVLALTVVPVATMGQGRWQRLRIMEWNVENLFDTLHASGRADDSFTPSGDHHWTEVRYWAKLGRLARTIAAAGEAQPVDLVALVEIENDSVLSNLVRRTKLRRLGYEYLTTSSADVRGINVALLYQPHRFRPLGADTLRFDPSAGGNGRPTRDALHVTGLLASGDTLDLVIVHWPSKRGGRAADRYRLAVARRLALYADSLMTCRVRPALVMTGDCNASYPEAPLREGLGVKLPLNKGEALYDSRALYLLTHKLRGRDDVSGTYKFRGEWEQLDHFIVSGSLLMGGQNVDTVTRRGNAAKGARLRTSPASCRLVDFPFLLQRERSGEGVRPYRTYLGTYYQGGYSDHLPIVLDLWY